MDKSKYELIKEWHELLKAGILTEEEFETKKQALLGNITVPKAEPTFPANMSLNDDINNNLETNFSDLSEKKSSSKKIITFSIIGIVVAVLALGGYWWFNERSTENFDEEETSVEVDENVIKIDDINSLKQEYFENPELVRMEYINKEIEITGVLNREYDDRDAESWFFAIDKNTNNNINDNVVFAIDFSIENTKANSIGKKQSENYLWDNESKRIFPLKDDGNPFEYYGYYSYEGKYNVHNLLKYFDELTKGEEQLRSHFQTVEKLDETFMKTLLIMGIDESNADILMSNIKKNKVSYVPKPVSNNLTIAEKSTIRAIVWKIGMTKVYDGLNRFKKEIPIFYIKNISVVKTENMLTDKNLPVIDYQEIKAFVEGKSKTTPKSNTEKEEVDNADNSGSDNSNIINSLLKAEQNQDISGIVSTFSDNIERYWDEKNISKSKLKEKYNNLWEKVENISYENVNISKVSANTYDMKALYSYYSKKDNSKKEINVHTRYIFNNNGKIISTYGVK